MTIVVKHSVSVQGADCADKSVNAAQWNDDHIVSGAVSVGAFDALSAAVSVVAADLSNLTSAFVGYANDNDDRVSSVSVQVTSVSAAVSVVAANLSAEIAARVALSATVSTNAAQLSALSVSVSAQGTQINAVSAAVSVVAANVSALSVSQSVTAAALSNEISARAALSGTVSTNAAQVSSLSVLVSTQGAQINSVSAAVSVVAANVSALSVTVSTVAAQVSSLSVLHSALSVLASSTAAQVSSLSVQVSALSARVSTLDARVSTISVDSGGIRWRTSVKTANQIVSVSALTNITSMNLSVGAGNTYAFKYFVIYQGASTTSGLGLGVTFPGMRNFAAAADIMSGAAGSSAWFSGQIVTTGDRVQAISVQTAGTNYLATLEGVFTVSTTGTLQLQANAELAGNGLQITIVSGTTGQIWQVN